MRAILLIALAGIVAGCDGAPSKNVTQTSDSNKVSAPSQEKKSYLVEIKGGTPDLALKSWWKVLDANTEYDFDNCEASGDIGSPRSLSRDKILTSGMKEYFSPSNLKCSKEIYDRSIDEVKVESDSRATIFATIKNATPVPQDVHLDDSDTKNRANGEKFKYVLERESAQDNWKVAEVYKDYGFVVGGTRWSLQYNPKYKSTHTFVFSE